MDELTQRLAQLSSAEEFMDFFGLAYEPAVLQVNRLHILKRFHQYLGSADGPRETMDSVVLFRHYRDLLARAYGDFVRSTPAQERVFKVLQQAQGLRRVSLSQLRDALADKRSASGG